MRFDGFWISQEQGKVEVRRAVFDETELSQASGWTQACQNEDDSLDHGFIDPLSMLRDVSQKLVGHDGEVIVRDSLAKFVNGEKLCLNSIQDLAILVLLFSPTKGSK